MCNTSILNLSASNISVNSVTISNSTNILGNLQINSNSGSAGQVLTSNGTGTVPTWNSLSSVGFGWVGTAASNLSMGSYSIIGSTLDSSGTNLTIGGNTATSLTLGKALNTTNILGNLQIGGSAGTTGQVLTSNNVSTVWSNPSWVGTATSNLSMGTNSIICNNIDASATTLTIGGVTAQGVTLGKALTDTNILGNLNIAGSAGSPGQVLRSNGTTAVWDDNWTPTATSGLNMTTFTINASTIDTGATSTLRLGNSITTGTINIGSGMTTGTINIGSATANVSTTNLSTTNLSANSFRGATCTIPIGGIIMYSGTWPPDPTDPIDRAFMSNMHRTDCWVLCDGGASYTKPSPMPFGISNYSDAPIANNNLVITLSNSNQKTIKIPDLRGRFVMGYIGSLITNFAYSGTITSANATNQQLLASGANQTGATIAGVANYPGGINKFGGVMTQALASTELPAHSHNVPTHTHPMPHTHNIAHTHNMQHFHEYYTVQGSVTQIGGGGGKVAASTTAVLVNTSNASYTGISSNAAGSGQSFVNTNDISNQTSSDVSTPDTSVNAQALVSGLTGGPIGATVGQADPRSNLPPYWVLAYIMRIG